MPLSNKQGLCLHREGLKTVWGGARCNLVGRIEFVWDEEICPLSLELQGNVSEVRK